MHGLSDDNDKVTQWRWSTPTVVTSKDFTELQEQLLTNCKYYYCIYSGGLLHSHVCWWQANTVVEGSCAGPTTSTSSNNLDGSQQAAILPCKVRVCTVFKNQLQSMLYKVCLICEDLRHGNRSLHVRCVQRPWTQCVAVYFPTREGVWCLCYVLDNLHAR